MSALTDDVGFQVNTLVVARRGMTDEEADQFLRTGQLPDLNQDPISTADDTPIMSESAARGILARDVSLIASGNDRNFFLSTNSHNEIPNSDELAFKFDPKQPRGKDGKWTDGVGGIGAFDLPKIPTQGKPSSSTSLGKSTKKITPAIIYKKHGDGTVVAQSSDGSRRMRWDASKKKFAVDERKNDEWEETQLLTKSVAYEDTKQANKWFTPSEVKNAPAPSAPEKAADKPDQTSTKLEPSTSSPEPETSPTDSQPTVKTKPDLLTQAEFTGPTIKIPNLPQDLIDEFMDLHAKQSQVDFGGPTLTSSETSRLYDLDYQIRQASDNSVLDNIKQRATIAGALNAWRVAQGITDEPIDVTKKRLADEVRDAFTDKKIGVRVTPNALANILDAGRFKSQFETSTSSGANSPTLRAQYESQWFGIGQGLPPTQAAKVSPESRPIYGYVMVDGVRPTGRSVNTMSLPTSTDLLSQYGDIQVVLKNDVRDRTTAMFGDSLDARNNGMPSPVNDPTYESFTPRQQEMFGSEPLAASDRKNLDGSFRGQTYAEAQIHGGVTTNDIEEVIFANEPSAEILAKLKSASIPWRTLSYDNVDAFTNTERNAARKHIVEDIQWLKQRQEMLDDMFTWNKNSEKYLSDREKIESEIARLTDVLIEIGD